MISKRTQKLLAVLLIAVTTFIGAKFLIKKITAPNQPITYTQMKGNNKANKDIIHKETIVNNLKSVSKLEIINASLNQEVTIKQGYNNNLFKNNKIVRFFGIGKYILDLEKINSNNIQIDDKEKSITIFTSLPTVNIELLEHKTTFQDEKGLLSFYDQKTSIEEFEKLKSNVKASMTEKLMDEDYSKIVKEKTKENLTKMLNKLTQNNYKININFVE